ncbi:high molecular weight rhoptry protein 3 [Plasmodium brasilianum]|uniref:High molecular weight rhoptry protein 3 n=1 Tax=Plasmodium brasilianum TaxID=5824 RepID=A0ACB9YCR9_PLABR|nr:high molecular weight rhoptry protein 3 [Plasmodium brasilianum]
MRKYFFVTFFVTCFITLAPIHGKDYFSGYLNKELNELLKCNFIAYYYLKSSEPDPDSFLDFVGEPEQFYWFIEYFLSVPFKVPWHLKHANVYNFLPCLKRSWVSEFLRKYEEPAIEELMESLDNEQRSFFSHTFKDKKPTGKFTAVAVKEFHKYCILPPIIETNIRIKGDGGYLTFQLNKDEYKIYLSSVGTHIAALKNLFLNMKDEKRKNTLKIIIENEKEKHVQVACPTFYMNLQYSKDCNNQPNFFACVDNYIRKACSYRDIKKNSENICDHLLFLFGSLRKTYMENFKKFLLQKDKQLTKPQSVWGVPLFKKYAPDDYRNKNKNIPTNIFKSLNAKNKLFFSFYDGIPKSAYYVDVQQPMMRLSDYVSSIYDKLHHFFNGFKQSPSQIKQLTIRELSHEIFDFSFKQEKDEIECKNVKKSLNLNLEVDVMKGAAAEKICKIIERHVLTKRPKISTKKFDFKIKLDDVHKGFRIRCILLSTHVEAYNIIRQLLNLESVLSLTRYTSLYLHKFFKSVKSLKGNFLYNNADALKYARSCGRSVLHVPAVLYRRNIYLAETFLSLYVGLSNLVSSNPSSPFFEYAIIGFLVTYFNKGSEKFILYFISIISVLYINVYYYEQLYCHYNDKFQILRSKMINPNVAHRVIANINKIINKSRYSQMRAVYRKFEGVGLFSKERMFEVLYDFDEFLSTKSGKEGVKFQDISDETVDLETTNDGIGYRIEDVFFESDQQESEEAMDDDMEDSIEGSDKNQQYNASQFINTVPDNVNLNINDKNKELELELYKYIGNLEEKGLATPGTSVQEPNVPSDVSSQRTAGRSIKPLYKDIKNKMEQVGKEVTNKRGKSLVSKIKKGVDIVESTNVLDEDSTKDSSVVDSGSSLDDVSDEI